jgi:hypothetical protein
VDERQADLAQFNRLNDQGQKSCSSVRRIMPFRQALVSLIIRVFTSRGFKGTLT